MTFTLVAHGGSNCTGSNPSLPNPGSLNTTGANLIVVGIFGGFNSASTVLTDNLGNTYTLAKYEAASSRDEGLVYYCVNPIVGAAHTWSTSPTVGNFCGYYVMAFSGSGAFDQVNAAVITGNGTITTQQAGSITPTVDGELICAFYGADDPACTGGTPYAVDSGFTLLDSVIDVPGALWGGCSAYFVQTTAGAINPTMTRSVATGSGFFSASIIVSFMPAILIAPLLTQRKTRDGFRGPNAMRQQVLNASLPTVAPLALLANAFSAAMGRIGFSGNASLAGAAKSSSFLNSASKIAMPITGSVMAGSRAILAFAGKSALVGTARSVSTAVLTFAGKGALAAKGMAQSTLKSTFAGTTPLSGRAASASSAKGLLGFFSFLFGRASSASQAKGTAAGAATLQARGIGQSKIGAGAKYAVLLTSRTLGSTRAFFGPLSGTLSLAARTIGASFGRMVPPGAIALLGRAIGATMARISFSGTLPLAGSARAQSRARGATLVSLFLKGASTGSARALVGLKAAAALAGASRGAAFVKSQPSFRALLAGSVKAASLVRGSGTFRVLLAGTSRGASSLGAVIGGIAQFAFLFARVSGVSRLIAGFQIFGPSKRRAQAASQNRTATVPVGNTLTLVPTVNTTASAEDDRHAQAADDNRVATPPPNT